MANAFSKVCNSQWRAQPIHSTTRKTRHLAARAISDATKNCNPTEIKIPRSIHEVDNGRLLGYGVDLAEGHPGFLDDVYKKRRVAMAKIAKGHEMGSPIPEVEYTSEEISTWGTVFCKLQELHPDHACAKYNSSAQALNFSTTRIPQLEDVSNTLKNATGWQVRPVAGLMHPRDFLNGFAFKTFHSTQFVRHHTKPMFSPEPDVIHELLGHVPLLTDPAYSELVHTIGVASLGATEKELWHLAKAYFHTVEFGVVRESGKIKAFGAGILSSYGELEWMAKEEAELKSFDPFSKQPPFLPGSSHGYRKSYIVLESFQDAAEQLGQYSKSIAKVPLNGDDGCLTYANEPR